MSAALDFTVVLLMFFEGLVLHAYQDCVGVWTIGYGETLGVRSGMVWTKEYAEQRLRIRATQFMLQVVAVCPQLLNEPPKRLAACVSLAYNIGINGFKISSVRRCTARREYTRAGESFMLWNKAGGKVNRGLTFRRGRERDYYLLKR